MIGIYKIENKINGKCYIGQSIDIYRRWRSHKNTIGQSQYPLYLAMQKYGLDSFIFTVLEECSIEHLDEREIFYIEKFNSYYNGYNQTLGGSSHGCGFVKISDEELCEIIDLLKHSDLTQKEISVLFNIGQDTVSEINQGKTRIQSNETYPLRKRGSFCILCNQKITAGASYCKGCYLKLSRKAEKPSKEQLYQELKESNFCAVGRKYGVSDQAIRKWCKSYGLPTHASDYK